MKCKFCMSVEKDLSSEIVVSHLSRMNPGDTAVFAGGEPLLYRELEDYLKLAKNLGLRTKIHTNGTLLKSCNFLDYIDIINLPLDGPEKIHDRMRGSGHFRVVMKSFELKKEFTITTVLTKLNLMCVKELAELINSIYSNRNIYNWKIFMFKPKGRGKKYRNIFEIQKKDFERAVKTAADIADVKVFGIPDPDTMKTEVVRVV